MKEFVKKNTILVIIISCAILFIGAYAIYEYYGLLSYRAKVRDIVIETKDAANIPDGTYIGECDVGYISAKVSVTVRAGEIASIELIEYKHDRGAAAVRTVDDILNQQRVEVDAVSGATNSSRVIMKAVDDALSRR